MADEREVIGNIEFVIEKDPKGIVVKTHKNPYILVGRPTKFEAVCVAFTKYLERLNEMENPELFEAAKALQLAIDSKNAGEKNLSLEADSNGEPEVK